MTNIHNAKVSDSTLDDVIDETVHRTRRIVSRIIILIVAAIVAAAALGAFDVESSTDRSEDRMQVHVRHPLVARAGNEVELEILVSSDEPLPDTCKLRLAEDYLLFFEDLAVFPDPESQSSDAAGAVEFEVAPRPGATQMLVRITGRASDQWDLRTDGNLEVEVGASTVNVPFTTWRVP
ncbi:hypothetical protein [Glutamicibacter soli]